MTECKHGNRGHQCIYCEAEELQMEVDNIRLVYQDAIKIFRDNYHLEEALKDERGKNEQFSAALRYIYENRPARASLYLARAIRETESTYEKSGSKSLSEKPITSELPPIGSFVEIKEWVNTWEVLRYFNHKELGYGVILCCHTTLNSFGFLAIDDFKERIVK